MATATFMLISKQTLASNAATVTFSSITSTYKNLTLVVNAACTGATGEYIIQVNGVTGSYYHQTIYANSGSVGSSMFQNTSYIYANATMINNQLGNSVQILELPHYTDTSGYPKPYIYKSAYSAANYYQVSGGCNYDGTLGSNAINTIACSIISGSQFAAGSKFYLYGEVGV